MYKQRKQIHILVLLIIDTLSIIFADILSIFIRYNLNSIFWTDIENDVSKTSYYEILILLVPVILIVYAICKLYRKPLEASYSNDINKIIIANIISALILMSLIFIVRQGWEYSRAILILFTCINIVLDTGFRLIYRKVLRNRYIGGYNVTNILVIGTDSIALEYLKTIHNYKKYGYNIKGVLALDNKLVGYGLLGYPIIGHVDEFEKLQEQNHYDEVVIALQLDQVEEGRKIISICDEEGVRVKFIPSYYEFLKVDMNIESLEGLPLLVVRDVPLDSIFNKFIKRVFDICFSIVAIVLTSPIMLFVAIGVKATSSGPILFKQERVSLNNKTFNMLKFRSMKVQTEEASDIVWTTENDPRKTKFGSFIRRTSLDELPQFFNVLRGDMSIVGPRPERPYWVNQFKKKVPEYMLRHYVKSGITGWAQVTGWRGDTSIEERIKCDNYYIQNWTLLLDIKIIFLTVFKGLINKNAY